MPGCILCSDIALHNRFCQEHKTRTPRAPAVAKLLGCTPEDIIRHRRHQDCYVVKFPVSGAREPPAEKVSSETQSQRDPLHNLETLQKILQQTLYNLYHNSTLSPGDIVKVTSEIRSLIVASEDLSIKLTAAQGSKNSAFTQPEMQEIYAAFEKLTPSCREELCGLIKPSS